jgi:2-oxo-4-hydroxy-4-carboxy-5-ureidoimidazoline decarboxylase
MTDKPLKLEDVNALDRAAFVDRFGGIFEHSLWVAERAWPKRPFKDVAALHAAMVAVMRAASEEEKLGLLRAHPMLAGKEMTEGRLTAASKGEQGSAGLDRLSPDEFKRLAELNTSYSAKFGFPFIMAVRGRTKEQILAAFEARLKNEAKPEFETALAEVEKITRIRLDRLFGNA